MVRRFFRDSAIYAIPAAISGGMSFFLFPLYAHAFTRTQYGVYDLLILAGMLVGWTVALEIYTGVGRYVAGEAETDRARRYASTGFLFALGMYSAFALLAELAAEPLSRLLLGDHQPVALLRVAVSGMWMQGVLSIPQAQLRWQMRPMAFAVAAITNASVTASLSALFVFGLHLGVKGALLGQACGAAVAFAYVMIATRGTFRLTFEWDKCKQMLRFSTPMVASGMGLFLNLYADRLVIQHLRSLSDVGLYGVGYRIAMIVTLLLAGFQAATLPLVLARKDDPTTPAAVARIFRIFSALGLSTFVFLALMAPPLLRILAAARFQRASSVVPLLVIASLFGGMYMFAVGLTIAERTATIARLTVIAGVANVILAVILVPPLGIAGAGVATAVTSVTWFAGLMAAGQQSFAVPHDWRRLTTAFAAVVAFVAAAAVILPSARAQALSADTLVVRGVLVIAGVALSIWLALDAREFPMLIRTLSTTSRRFVTTRGGKLPEPGPSS